MSSAKKSLGVIRQNIQKELEERDRRVSEAEKKFQVNLRPFVAAVEVYEKKQTRRKREGSWSPIRRGDGSWSPERGVRQGSRSNSEDLIE